MSLENSAEQISCQNSKEHQIRKQKVQALLAMKIEPWPEVTPAKHTSIDIKQMLEQDSTSTTSCSMTGRLMIKREHGKSCFAQLQDRKGLLQIYLKKEDLGETKFDLFLKLIDTGDILWVTGTPFYTKTNEPTLQVQDFILQAKCLHPLAEKYHGLTDIEQRYRQRYLDLICNQESFDRFKKRSIIVDAVRDFLKSHDFIEVETPMLHPMAGGAIARPFVTHHNAYDIDLFLRIAPELYLKRLIVGGLERVFEINRSFRNEGVSTRHNPEFSMLEFYMAGQEYNFGMTMVEDLLRFVARKVDPSLIFPFQHYTLDFGQPFTRMTMHQAVSQVGDIDPALLTADKIDQALQQKQIDFDPTKSFGDKLLLLFEELVETKLVQPTFITGFPVEVSPLAKEDATNPGFVSRFELFIAGMELSNAYNELNDPFDQAKRFMQQLDNKEKGDQEAHSFDQDYITALEYGLTPTLGVGIGIDRLTMMLTNTSSIKDVILFPTMRPKD